MSSNTMEHLVKTSIKSSYNYIWLKKQRSWNQVSYPPADLDAYKSLREKELENSAKSRKDAS